LWEGKLIEEVRRQQPKLFRQVQENPRAFCPPGGETLVDAEERIAKQVAKLCKKHKGETIAVVIPEPLATLVASRLKDVDFMDMWDSEQDNATWEMIDSETRACLAVPQQLEGEYLERSK
jgi:alpha-ribazole phosphatase/probable phosphoglycerate mutase